MRFFNKITVSLVIIVVFSIFFLQEARATEGQTPFGGFSIVVINCDISRNHWIIQVPVAGPANIIYQDGVSQLYEFGNITKSGNWLLGNVTAKVPCWKEIGGDPVHLGDFKLITIVGTSDPSKIAQSGQTGANDDDQEEDNSEPRPDDEEATNDEPTEPDEPDDDTRPTGPGSETPAENGRTEEEVRAELEANGVEIAPGLSPTLSPVSKLPNNAIAGVEDLKEDCGPNCDVMITSGARQPGNPTAPGEHGTGKPVFDLNKDPGAGGLDEYIVDNSSSNYTDRTGTHYIMPNGDEYLDENYGVTGGTGAHWHVRINADHMPSAA